jgi:hypothetical protein
MKYLGLSHVVSSAVRLATDVEFSLLSASIKAVRFSGRSMDWKVWKDFA